MIEATLDQLDLHLSSLRSIHASAVDKMTASMAKYGQLTPVTVVADKDRMVLVDGFKRHRSAVQLGMKKLSVIVLQKSSSEAKALIYLLNRPASFSIINEANLVRDLVEVEGLNQVETATLLERHKSWVSRRLAMIRDLAPEVVEDIRLAMVPAGVGSSLARLPRDNQADFCAAIQQHGLTSGEVKQLVDLWCKAGEPGIQKCLLTSPRQSLQIVKERHNDLVLLVQTILNKLATLVRQVQEEKLSHHAARVVPGFLDQMQGRIEELKELTGGSHEPVK